MGPKKRARAGYLSLLEERDGVGMEHPVILWWKSRWWFALKGSLAPVTAMASWMLVSHGLSGSCANALGTWYSLEPRDSSYCALQAK